ncbi:MAG: ankyrin repeat domain-containing protein [Methylococcaceae bacterium]|nr:ankyrin repeat domain-containing protein [Methylococcaceae bacterium]
MIDKNLSNTRRINFIAAIVIGTVVGLCQADVALAVDAVQARKDLQQMGIEFTEQQFAKSAGAVDKAAVQLFLDAGIDVNAGEGAALGLAAGRGKLEMVKLLLDKRGRSQLRMPYSLPGLAGIKRSNKFSSRQGPRNNVRYFRWRGGLKLSWPRPSVELAGNSILFLVLRKFSVPT